MDVQDVIDLSLTNTHTTSSQLNAADLLRWFNISRKNLANKISTFVNEKFFYEIWETDAVAGAENGEYLLPSASSSVAGAYKIFNVAVKPNYNYNHYINAREVDPSALPYDWTYYLLNQPKEDPIFYIADNSYFVAPQWNNEDLPTVPAGNKMIKVDGIKTFIDLDAADSEADILIPEVYHELIALRMEKFIYKARGKRQDSLLSEQEYTAGWKIMVQELTNRDDGQTILSTPNESNTAYGE